MKNWAPSPRFLCGARSRGDLGRRPGSQSRVCKRPLLSRLHGLGSGVPPLGWWSSADWCFPAVSHVPRASDTFVMTPQCLSKANGRGFQIRVVEPENECSLCPRLLRPGPELVLLRRCPRMGTPPARDNGACCLVSSLPQASPPP